MPLRVDGNRSCPLLSDEVGDFCSEMNQAIVDPDKFCHREVCRKM